MSLLYKEISKQIITDIKSGKYNQGRFPTERELCIHYAVSRQTIRSALKECEEAGLIEKRQGSGIYLTPAYLKSVNHCALIVPALEEYIYPRMISELESRLNTVNFTLSVYESRHSLKLEKDILNTLLANPVSTLIVISAKNMLPSPFETLYKQLSSNGCRIIFVGNPYPNCQDYSYIKFDDFYSGYSVAKRIKDIEQNWCAIFISELRSNVDRYYGFVQSMADNDYDFDESNIHWIHYEDLLELRSNNISVIRNILESYATAPNIVIAGEDEIAYSCINCLKNTRKLSEDISFYTFDNSYIRRITDIPVHSYDGDMGMLYAKLVEMTISKAKKEKEVITLPSSLNV